jgi:hypothetical protein
MTEQELNILVTDNDKTGTDIAEMSNFFDVYVQQLTSKLSTNTAIDIVENIPIANLRIISDVVNQAKVAMDGKYGYIPDFNSLPLDVRSKLRSGIYKIGKSKQVDGNMRPVILDWNGVRVKDITLKRVRMSQGTTGTAQSMANQIQMKQIYEKLDEIQELQDYQIDRDRDRDIITPFLTARDHILRAQIGEISDDKIEDCKKATDEITKAINAIYTDISTSSSHLVKLTNRWIFQNRKQIIKYIGYISQDFQLVTKYVGMQMHVFDYLGDKKKSDLELERYQHRMQEYITKGINSKEQPLVSLMHMHYPYNDSNENYWYEFSKNMKPMLQNGLGTIEEKEIYLVSVEDIKSED